jgi:hypothetical protein
MPGFPPAKEEMPEEFGSPRQAAISHYAFRTTRLTSEFGKTLANHGYLRPEQGEHFPNDSLVLQVFFLAKRAIL